MLQSLNDVWQWICSNLANGSVLVWTIAGLLFLAASALTLACTRFGQRQPVWTCVGLSILAHLMLVAMASRVLMNQAVVGHGSGEFASVSVIDLEDPEQSEPAPGNPVVDPDGAEEDLEAAVSWSEFHAAPPAPAPGSLERPEFGPELVIEREVPELPPLPAAEPQPDPAVPPVISVSPVADPQPVDRTPRAELPALADSGLPPSPVESTRAPAETIADPLLEQELAHTAPPPPVDPEVASELTERLAADAIAGLQSALAAGEIPANSTAPAANPTENTVPVREALPIQIAAVPFPEMGDPAAELPTAPRMANPQLRAADLKPMPLEYSLRSASDKAAVAVRHGGSEQTEAAVQAALAWLAANQSADGRWDPRRTGAGVERKVLGHDRQNAGSYADTGISGLAILAFLSGGHTHFSGDYRETVRRGLVFIARSQTADGCLAGEARLFERMYCHSMATLAVGEAVAMTGDEQLRETLRRAVDFSVRTQNLQDGGWRYQPGDAGDLSQFGWIVLGLRSAELGGIEIPAGTREGMHRFLDQCSRGSFRGLASYRPREAISPTMTAEGLVCRYLLEKTPRLETVREATGYIAKSLPTESSVNYYYWYYGTMAMYQAGGPEWEQWNRSLTQLLVTRQISSGADRGAWPADGVWSGYGGRVYSTAMATLCLEVYYRYMPVYEALRVLPDPLKR